MSMEYRIFKLNQSITGWVNNFGLPDGTYGGVRGRGLITPSYSIKSTLWVGEISLAADEIQMG